MVKARFAACVLATLTSCGYDAHFADCVIRCTPSSGCPDGFTCGSEGVCRAAVCTEHTLELADALPAFEQATVTLSTCNLPGNALTVQRVCLRFSTEIPASARSLLIGQQRFEAGPCDGAAPSETDVCFDYVRPEADVVVRLDNTSPVIGCQHGAMTNVQLVFPCP